MNAFHILIVLLVAGGFILWLCAVRSSFGAKLSRRAKERFHNAELVRALLDLDERAREELFELYREKYGDGAARYARRTYRKWKEGKVRANRQTFERFLVDLPQVMSFDLKCEVLRRFMEEYAAQNDYKLTVYTDDWEEKLTPLIEEMVERPFKAELPRELERKLRWLSNGETQIAQKLLRAAQVAEGRLTASMLREEFAGIEKMLAAIDLKPKVTHRLKFPCGTITLDIKRR